VLVDHCARCWRRCFKHCKAAVYANHVVGGVALTNWDVAETGCLTMHSKVAVARQSSPANRTPISSPRHLEFAENAGLAWATSPSLKTTTICVLIPSKSWDKGSRRPKDDDIIALNRTPSSASYLHLSKSNSQNSQRLVFPSVLCRS